MYNDIVDLKNFYDSNLGHIARRLIRRKIKAVWPNISGMSLMGLGYTVSYLRPYLGEAERVFSVMPAQQGSTP